MNGPALLGRINADLVLLGAALTVVQQKLAPEQDRRGAKSKGPRDRLLADVRRKLEELAPKASTADVRQVAADILAKALPRAGGLILEPDSIRRAEKRGQH